MVVSDLPAVLQYLALFSLVYITSKILFAVIQFVYVYCMGSYPKFEKHGAWSVVTGATDGIGLAFAQELAKCGQNIVLISRNPEKLEATASELEKLFNVETMTVAVDFTKTDIYDQIKEKLDNLDIGVLVNNVGMSYSYPEYFAELPDRSNLVDKLLAVNVTSVAKMVDIVLPKMTAKKKGIILNVSSSSAKPPTPLLTLYAATKAFVDCFSTCLEYEYRNKGIIIQSVIPYFVATKLSKIRRSSFTVPTPTAFVQSTLKTIGRTTHTNGCVSHAIQGIICTSIPESLYKYVTKSMGEKTRKRALKRMSKAN